MSVAAIAQLVECRNCGETVPKTGNTCPECGAQDARDSAAWFTWTQLPATFATGQHKMIGPKFYVGRRDTRWDVYPQREPAQIVAHDWHGFWAFDAVVGWFKTPASFVFEREITAAEAEAELAL